MRFMLNGHRPGTTAMVFALACMITGACSSAVHEQITYWPDGTMRERWEAMDSDAGRTVRHGRYESWYTSGRVHEVGHYARGEKTGEWSRRYDHTSGTLMSRGIYVADQPHGRWSYWHNPDHMHLPGDHHAAHAASGHPVTEMPPLKIADYDMGIAHGDWISWHASGQVADSMLYQDGKLEGEVRVYREDGTLITSRSYQAGRRVVAADPS